MRDHHSNNNNDSKNIINATMGRENLYNMGCVYIYATSLVSGIFSGAIKPYSLIYVSIYICNH